MKATIETYFPAVIVTNVIFGFVSAVGGPVLPSIIIEFLGPDNLAMGYGFLLIFEGVGSFAGPPLAGNLVREKISYDLITLFLVNSMIHASRFQIILWWESGSSVFTLCSYF